MVLSTVFFAARLIFFETASACRAEEPLYRFAAVSALIFAAFLLHF